MTEKLITLTQLRTLASRILEYFKANITHGALTVSDDEEGNVTVTFTETKGES